MKSCIDLGYNYLFIIDKNSGNIVRITNLLKQLKLKQKKHDALLAYTLLKLLYGSNLGIRMSFN